MSGFIKQLSLNARSGQILSPLIDNYFANAVFPDSIPITVEPNKERDTAMHPSSNALQCLAETYAGKQGLLAPEKFTATNHKIFMIGHAYHGILQSVLIDMGLTKPEYIEHEHRRTNDGTVLDCSVDWRKDPKIKKALWWARGYADVSHCEIPGHGDALIDIKSASSFAFNKVGQDTGFWPKYEAQAQLYLDWHDVDMAIVLYQNKDTPHDFKERHIHRDRDFVAEIYDRWTEVAERAKLGDPPKCECDPDKHCAGREALGQ